jgi:hypothetical protein
MRMDAGTDVLLAATSNEHSPDVQGTAQSFFACTDTAESRSAVKIVDAEIMVSKIGDEKTKGGRDTRGAKAKKGAE